jgi:CRP-like cAMP-binding protein
MTMITTTDGTEIYCKDATLVGHCTNGGAVYIRRHGTKRVVLVAAGPPIMLKSAANPEGLPMEHFDKLRSGINVRDGEWLGEMGVIEGRSRNATAPAAADGEVEVLTARQFSERVSSELALARDLILRLSIRLRRIEDELRCRNSNLGKATPTNSTLSTRTTRQ